MTGYRKFAALFWKEFRFFRGPGIALIVMLVVIGIQITLISVLSPSFYENNIQMRSDNPITQYVLMPLMMLYSFKQFLFGTIFAYGLVAEHTGKTRVQLASLPVRGFLPLTAKISAILGWMCVMTAVSMVLSLMHRTVSGAHSAGVIRFFDFVLIESRYLMSTLVVMGLITAGYALAVAVGRLHVLISGTVFVGGYAYYIFLRMAVQRSELFPQLPGPGLPGEFDFAAYNLYFMAQILFAAVFAVAVIVPSLALYVRYREV
jgi:hypothetical protein